MMFASENICKFREALQRSKDIASTIRDEGIIAVLNGMMVRPSRLSVMEKGKIPMPMDTRERWIIILIRETVQKKVKLPANARL